MQNCLFNQVQWCQATIGAASKATSPKAGGTAGSPWRAAAGRKGAESGAGAVFAGRNRLMFVISGSCWVLQQDGCSKTLTREKGDDMTCDVPQAAKAAKAQAESETLAKAKSMVGCHGADNKFAALQFPNATRVLVSNQINQISNGICCQKNWGPSPSWSINQKWWSRWWSGSYSSPSNFIGCRPRVTTGTSWASQIWWEPLVGWKEVIWSGFALFVSNIEKFMNIPVRWQWFGATTTRFIFSKQNG